MNYLAVYTGTVVAVYPPDHPQNKSKYQYEYAVMVSLEGNAQIPVNNCILADSYGSTDNYEHSLLLPNSLVLVVFPKGVLLYGIIIGAVRNFKGKMPTIKNSQQEWKKRYNKFEISIDSNFNYMAKSDFGPFFQIQTDQIVLNDSNTECLMLSKKDKKISLNTNDLEVNVLNVAKTVVKKDSSLTVEGNCTIQVKGNVTLQVEGDVNVTCKNLKANVKESAQVECKELKAKASGNVDVQAGQNAKIKASKVYLNGEGSGITTEMSHMGVIDLITGVPVQASKTVFGDM
jgi:phage gp45-like